MRDYYYYDYYGLIRRSTVSLTPEHCGTVGTWVGTAVDSRRDN
jgi:hypothetical protein